ncbi:MAG: GMC family oxidoreductase [Actinobacteria bacterium]|nr:MAG: GMC family oxidoreductase [Actinomycetota bacterium]
MKDAGHFDVVIVGSGFGGSVAALRLVEKGYRVAVLEAGRRFADKDFPKTSWRIRDFLWAPGLGCTGVQRIHLLNNVMVLAGAGVGGGSLVYANTLYVPPAPFFEDRQWAHITDWADELAPYYDQATRMLGVVQNPTMTPSDVAMKEVADQMGVGDTFRMTPVGVFFGAGAGEKSPDPFFGGVGPERTGCIECGECMTGCRHNAKNTLPKNYLGLAERAGAQVFPLTRAIELRPPRAGGGGSGGEDGSWRVVTKRTGRPGGRRVFTADQVVVAAGTYSTQKLLHRMKTDGVLPKLSDRLGFLSRTNSESLVGAVGGTSGEDYSRGVAITSSFHPEPHTHIEPVRYGKGSNAMGLMQTVLTDEEPGTHRARTWLREVVQQRRSMAKLLNVRKWSERGVIALVMQDLDNSVTVTGKRTRFGRFKMSSRQGEGEPNPTYIPIANEAVRRLAKVIGGVPGGNIGEPLNAPTTAHFVGGAVISESAATGVIDPYQRVHGYPTLHVVDGAAVTANLGVNPSLTITAQAERALAMWPNKGEEDPRPDQGQEYRRLPAVPPRRPVVPADAPGAWRLPVALGMPKVRS